MADRTVTIGPGKTYVSLNAALAAELAANPNLDTNNGSGGAGILTFECHNFADTTLADTGAGWTTSASNYLNIVGAPADIAVGTTGVWSTSRYRLTPATNTSGMWIRTPYTRVKDLQVNLTVASTSAGRNCIYLNAANCRVERCIFKGSISGTNTAVGYGIYSDGGATCYVINCLAYDFVNGTEAHYAFSKGSGTTLFYNCTAVDSRNGFNGVTNWYNCGAAGCNTPFDAGGTQNQCSIVTPLFYDAVGDNFHLAEGDTTWRFRGVDRSAAGYTTDVDGQARAMWDIGFDEWAPDPGGIQSRVSL